MSSTSIIIAVILLSAAVNLSTGASVLKRQTTQTITYNQFLGIQIGWTRNQITQYLNNNAGQVILDSQYGNTDVTMVQYTNTNPFGVIDLILTNNQLTTKVQSGINQNQYPISRAQFDQITTGMTQAQVTSLVGNGGQVLGQGIGSVEIISYNGNTYSYAIVQITYLNGHVTSKTEVGL